MNQHHSPVPYLTSASAEPLRDIEKRLGQKQIEIETWFRNEWPKTPAPITSSVDLRNAGFKLAPVDTNLFPAGFNNLNPDFDSLAIQALQSIIGLSMPGCKKILLVPENHTRNTFYLESLATLYKLIINAGFDARIGTLNPDIDKKTAFTTASGKSIELEPIRRENNRLVVDDFNPCLILLNNDLSEGVPEMLKDLEQWVRPTEMLGWASRQKSNHFDIYQQVTEEFSKLINIDPWLISPLFTTCDNIDFKSGDGAHQVAEKVEQLLAEIKNKYLDHDIKESPFVFVKANSGTYGMGVMMVRSGEELLALNRKQRNKMSKSKGQLAINKVIIQEGVPTFESWQTDEAVCEPVVYMIGHYVIGGFYRVHKERSQVENLNAPGMHFEPLAFAKPCNYPDKSYNRFYAYGVIARLAALSAAREIANIKSSKETLVPAEGI